MLLGALALDLLWGEPPNCWHPVAWLGTVAGWLQRAAPKGRGHRSLVCGALLTGVAVAVGATAGGLVERMATRLPAAARIALLALVLKMSFSVRALASAAERVAECLERGELERARMEVRALVSRPAEDLGAEKLASAAIESVAENLCDSVVAPILAYAALGLPGAFGYRALNTLDAMIGYHGDYEDLGKVAARLDDLANLIPARLSALLLVGAAGLGFGDPYTAWKVLRRDHGLTESPNAGCPMSAASGALRVRLEKAGHYRLGAELPPPREEQIAGALRLYWAAVALTAGAAVVLSNLTRRRAGRRAS